MKPDLWGKKHQYVITETLADCKENKKQKEGMLVLDCSLEAKPAIRLRDFNYFVNVCTKS